MPSAWTFMRSLLLERLTSRMLYPRTGARARRTRIAWNARAGSGGLGRGGLAVHGHHVIAGPQRGVPRDRDGGPDALMRRAAPAGVARAHAPLPRVPSARDGRHGRPPGNLRRLLFPPAHQLIEPAVQLLLPVEIILHGLQLGLKLLRLGLYVLQLLLQTAGAAPGVVEFCLQVTLGHSPPEEPGE